MISAQQAAELKRLAEDWVRPSRLEGSLSNGSPPEEFFAAVYRADAAQSAFTAYVDTLAAPAAGEEE